MVRDDRSPTELETAGARLLVVLAKYWEPGQVKTRLAAAIGNQAAARLHQSFVITTLSRLANQGDQRWLAVSPATSLPQFGALPAVKRGGWSLLPQSEGDLGQRMKHLMELAFASGFDRVVLVGSDSPDLPPARVEQAFAALREDRVVVAPSSDGGYVLIGASRKVPPVFDAMPWSTRDLLARTCERLTTAHVSTTWIEGWFDVDEQADLALLRQRLLAAAADDALLRRLLVDLDQFVPSLIAGTRGG